MAYKNFRLRVLKGNIEIQEIAEAVGVHRNTMYRWFADGEMDELQRARVEQAIQEIKEKRAKQTV